MSVKEAYLDSKFRLSRVIRSRVFPRLSHKYVLIFITVIPVLLLFFFINFLPILWAIYASLHRIPVFSPEWEWVALENFQFLLDQPGLWAALERSLVFAGGSVGLQVILGVGIALVINRTFKLNKIVRALIFLPYLIPTAIVGFLALWMANSNFGVINNLLIDIGIVAEPIPWFGSPDFAMIAVIIANSWKFTIFVTIMVLARLQSIDQDFYDAAYISGASRFQMFRDITLPNLKGVLLIVILLRGIWMFNKFDILWVLTRGGPGDTTTTAPIYAYEEAFQLNNLGSASAIATILFTMLLVGAFVYFVVFKPAEGARVE